MFGEQRAPALVEETERRRPLFIVDKDAVPGGEVQRSVVRMADGAANEDAPFARDPDPAAPAFGFANDLGQGVELNIGRARRRVPRVMPNHFAGPAHELVGDMRFASTRADKWLPAVDRQRVDGRFRGHEEPFALADEGTRMATKTIRVAQTRVNDDLPNRRRDEALFSRGDAGGGRDSRDEPVALVKTTKEVFGFGARRLEAQQQVAFIFPAIENASQATSRKCQSEEVVKDTNADRSRGTNTPSARKRRGSDSANVGSDFAECSVETGSNLKSVHGSRRSQRLQCRVGFVRLCLEAVGQRRVAL